MVARLGFGKVAFATSLAAHAGVCLIAVEHGARVERTTAAAPLTELVALELSTSEDPARQVAAGAQPRELTPARPQPAVRAIVHEPSTPPPASTVSARPSSAATPVVAAAPSAPRFAMLVAVTPSGPTGAVVGSTSTAPVEAEWAAPIPAAAAEIPAKLRFGTPPAYPARALSAGVERDVPLELVVDRSGVVTSARALSHVGYGLDEAALASVRSYRFTPARRAGRAVAVRMRWVMRFEFE